MERDCESELSKLNIEQNACIYHFGASVIHGQRSNILRLLSFRFTHIYTVHLQTICMMFICDTCKACISVGVIGKHIKPCTDWKL